MLPISIYETEKRFVALALGQNTHVDAAASGWGVGR